MGKDCLIQGLHHAPDPVLFLACQGVLEEQLTLDGDSTYNAHFGESMAALGDIDDDGFPGQCNFLHQCEQLWWHCQSCLASIAYPDLTSIWVQPKD